MPHTLPPHRPGSARCPGCCPPPRRVLTPATRTRMHASPTRSLQLSHLPRGHTHRHAHTPLLPTPRRRFAPPLAYPHARGLPPAPAPALSDPCTRRMNANCVPRAVRVRAHQRKPVIQSPNKQIQPRSSPRSPHFATSPWLCCTPDPRSCTCGTCVHRPVFPLHARTHSDPLKPRYC